jgi:hypothetical protein
MIKRDYGLLIWPEMYGSGAVTGSGNIQMRRQLTLQARLKVNIVFFVGARGATSTAICIARSASGTDRAAATMALGFVVYVPGIDFFYTFLFYSFSLFPYRAERGREIFGKQGGLLYV